MSVCNIDVWGRERFSHAPCRPCQNSAMRWRHGVAMNAPLFPATAPGTTVGRRLVDALALAAGLAALLWPALWNGWPIVFFDTGGYIRRAILLELEPGRSLFYGLFLEGASLNWLTPWGPVAAQAAATLWLLHLTLRALDLPAGPVPVALVAALLSGVTGVAWYAAQLMPDILVPLLVLALWLLGFRYERLHPAERAGIAAVALLALLSHMSSMALAMGLVLVTATAAVAARRFRYDVPIRVLPPALTVAASLLLMPLLHLAIVGKAVYTPGGAVFVFGRLVQDGIAQKQLAAACPQDEDAYALCRHRHEMPTTANDFIWHEASPFRKIGWWEGADAELSRLSRDAIAAFPGEFVLTSIRSTLQQLVEVETGDGLDEWQEATRWTVASQLPAHAAAFEVARQQRALITQDLFDALNRVHVPVAHLSALALPLALAWAVRARRPDVALLAGVVILALLGNAFICGVLSNPHDRYQSRLVWVATFVVVAALLARRRESYRPK